MKRLHASGGQAMAQRRICATAPRRGRISDIHLATGGASYPEYAVLSLPCQYARHCVYLLQAANKVSRRLNWVAFPDVCGKDPAATTSF